MSDLAADVAEYVRNVAKARKGQPAKRLEIIREIMALAQHNPAWPTATVEQWSKAIVQAKERGLLCVDSETVWMPVVESAKVTQRSLFE